MYEKSLEIYSTQSIFENLKKNQLLFHLSDLYAEMGQIQKAIELSAEQQKIKPTASSTIFAVVIFDNIQSRHHLSRKLDTFH